MDVRSLAFLGSGLLAAVSLVPVAVSRSPETPPTARPGTARPDTPTSALVDVVEQTTRLRTYMSAAPAPRQPARNPFRFAERRRAESSSARAPELLGRMAQSPPLRPFAAAPPLTLIGIAERQPAGEPIAAAQRIAIVSGLGDVHLVSAGDRIAGRYSVVAVGVDAVELRDEAADTLLRLGLK